MENQKNTAIFIVPQNINKDEKNGKENKNFLLSKKTIEILTESVRNKLGKNEESAIFLKI